MCRTVSSGASPRHASRRRVLDEARSTRGRAASLRPRSEREVGSRPSRDTGRVTATELRRVPPLQRRVLVRLLSGNGSGVWDVVVMRPRLYGRFSSVHWALGHFRSAGFESRVFGMSDIELPAFGARLFLHGESAFRLVGLVLANGIYRKPRSFFSNAKSESRLRKKKKRNQSPWIPPQRDPKLYAGRA